MAQHANYKSDVSYAVQITRVILRLIGAWPLSDNASKLERVTCRALNFISYFLFFVTVVPGMLRVVMKESVPLVKLKIMGPLLNCVFAMVKYSILLYKAEDIRRALKKVEGDWKDVAYDEDRKIMLSKAKIGRTLVLLSACFMYGGGLSHRSITPLSRGSIVTPDNITIRPLACPSYFVIFDEQISPAYEIVFALQFFSGFLVYSLTSGTCGLSAFLALHVCGQLRLLINEMKRLVDTSELQPDMVAKRIASIVEHQADARTFLMEIEKIIEYMRLVEIAGCVLTACLAGYYVLMEWEKSDTAAMITYFLIVTSFVFSIFIFCYIGQLIDNESSDVGLTSTTLDWYYLPVKQAQCLLLIISMSNYPIKITAGKMIEMSLVSFTSIMKVCVGYFNILRLSIN